MAKSQRQGVTLVELLVVSTVIALLAAISFPVLQIVRQREKENRLKEILTMVRKNGIGLGVPTYSYEKFDTSFSSEGYRNFVIRKLMQQVASNTITPAQASFAIASGTATGTIYPIDPAHLVNPMSYVASLSIDEVGGYTLATITQRFIRSVPDHPFKDWFPNAHWEFKAVATSSAAGGGPWYASESWPYGKATGVIDIRSVGAGFSLNGQSTDSW